MSFTRLRCFACAGLLAATLAATPSPAAPLRVPAFTAYTLPEPDRGARISERSGVSRWADPGTSINWYGQFAEPGALTVQVQLRLPREARSRLQLTLAGHSREVVVTGTGEDAPVPVTADFGEFAIPAAGYQRLALNSLNPSGQPSGDLEALLLDGPAVTQAQFNLKERRNAASVHLAYPVPAGTNLAAFYCEVTAVEDPSTTFYMACGWHRGYFGMQVNSPTERRIIFSVWDSGNEGVDRQNVADENRVKLMGKGEGVFTGDFGNEGTGGHSHLKYRWKTGETQRFLVTAQPTQQTFTIYAGYYFHPDDQRWMLISSWKAPKEGGWLKRPHSFSENFGGSSGHLVRKALYGNQWIQRDTGEWLELTTATFSHDPTGRSDRLDRFMGVEQGRFFLSHGGFVPGFTKFGDAFTRPAQGHAPANLVLPPPTW